MSKKILYTDFEDAASIIENMLNSKELKKAMTRNSLYRFWNKIVDKKLADKSKPYGLGGNGLLIVACENSAVAQELVLGKIKILEELQPYLKSLHIKIKDIKFDCKKWEAERMSE